MFLALPSSRSFGSAVQAKQIEPFGMLQRWTDGPSSTNEFRLVCGPHPSAEILVSPRRVGVSGARTRVGRKGGRRRRTRPCTSSSTFSDPNQRTMK
ncbi:hypothetical protein GWI33_012304 [Rhynchophorus ferrugineus]|uniref:Uncharacterized protein n=1 Tax=Rhynchophorus ferrugineus TaxID=354439 RepID=A0A834MCJ5_RHYFE|nr:hypothetical protein GWI33_012304 [Rhynchophorus ferrugineus]